MQNILDTDYFFQITEGKFLDKTILDPILYSNTNSINPCYLRYEFKTDMSSKQFIQKVVEFCTLDGSFIQNPSKPQFNLNFDTITIYCDVCFYWQKQKIRQFPDNFRITFCDNKIKLQSLNWYSQYLPISQNFEYDEGSKYQNTDFEANFKNIELLIIFLA